MENNNEKNSMLTNIEEIKKANNEISILLTNIENQK